MNLAWQLAPRGVRAYGPRIDTMHSSEENSEQLLDHPRARLARQKQQVRRDPNGPTQRFPNSGAADDDNDNLPGRGFVPSRNRSMLRRHELVAF